MILLKLIAILFVFNACTGKISTTESPEGSVDILEIKKDSLESDIDSFQINENNSIKETARDETIINPEENKPNDSNSEVITPQIQETFESEEDPITPTEDEVEDTIILETVDEEKPPIAVKEGPDHNKLNRILKAYVSASGNVNYKGLKNNQGQLDEYLSELKSNFIKNDWSRNAKMAYWINAYNAFTLKLIIDNYPVKSILDLHGGKTWDVRWIELGDKKYTLNQIENEILRPVYKDPRIHFAVNCAAKSCPLLLNEAWTEGNLEVNLERQTIAFINNTSENQISANEVHVSKIFEWYSEDFGDLISYLNKYSKIKISPNASISFNEYSWALNKQ